eukprot:CAMPEP_0198149500 /NCGR_PEP_ID=MMETSP1443-20131203/46894_1 /TAXON_ID=186043 /ORGANISM="Entomoneis sp., Strain CCMP2396" /LENGTH=411 /DNA_ID=CAMNT_0043814561 /DNA_START=141 /DNA_END=1376 /DNA_ORIENTATION=-
MAAGVVQGFTVPPQTHAQVPAAATGLKMSDSTGFDSFELSNPKNIPYGERSRVYRRTVYTHDDWKKHRSQDRFAYYLSAIFRSGVYKNMFREVGATVTVAAFIVVYDCLTGGFSDFQGILHDPILPMLPIAKLPVLPFTLAAPSLGLLLVFRTNSSYRRWDEARKNWGMNINHTRDLVRLANVYYDSTGVTPEQRQADLDNVALCTWAFVRAMKRHLSPEEEDEEAFQEEMLTKLPQQQAEMIIDAAHRPNRALQDLSYAIESLPMHYIRKNEVQAAVTIFEDNLGSSERLLTSPVPVFYSRHLARFLAIWLLLLPFALVEPMKYTWNSVGLIPATAILSVFLFGIEELSTQLEEPFTILPMQVFCDKIYNWCMEIVSWSPGDNGRPLRPVRTEHAYFTDGSGQDQPRGYY